LEKRSVKCKENADILAEMLNEKAENWEEECLVKFKLINITNLLLIVINFL